MQVIEQAELADAMHRLDFKQSREEKQQGDTLYSLGNQIQANFLVLGHHHGR